MGLPSVCAKDVGFGIIRPSTRLSIQAPEISPRAVDPAPKGHAALSTTLLSPQKSHPESGEPADRSASQRDLLVAILMQREAEVTAKASIVKSKPTPQS